jgi:hypothetical protein
LDELAGMVSALDEEIVGYLSLSFNDETVVPGRTVLLGLGAGWLMVRMGRHHCYKIANIYCGVTLYEEEEPCQASNY